MKECIRNFYLLPLLMFSIGLAACSPPLKEADFAGKWQSSKARTAIYLEPNGEWEIRGADGTVLQYGIWRYDDQKIWWTDKVGDSFQHEANQVLSFTPGEFKLRETDGSETTFQKLD